MSNQLKLDHRLLKDELDRDKQHETAMAKRWMLSDRSLHPFGQRTINKREVNNLKWQKPHKSKIKEVTRDSLTS